MPFFGLLGCSHVHVADAIDVLVRRDELDGVIVWDADADRARDVAAELRGSVSVSVDALVESADLTAVAVLGDTASHPALVTRAVTAHKHVFIEKPLATSADAASEMVDAIERAGVVFDTGYFLREMQAAAELRRRVQSGKLGRIVTARGRFAHAGALRGDLPADSWMTDPARAGYGGLGDLGIHVIDLLLWLLSDRVESVVAATTSVLPDWTIDPGGQALMTLSSGTIASIGAGWVEHPGCVTLELFGTEGSARLCAPHLAVDAPARADSLSFDDVPRAGAALERFLDILAGRRESGDAVRTIDALHHSAILDAIYESCHSRRWTAPL